MSFGLDSCHFYAIKDIDYCSNRRTHNRAMANHFCCAIYTVCALRSIATVSRPSVRLPVDLSVRPSVTLCISWFSSKALKRIISLGSSLFGAQHRQSSPMGTSQKFGWNMGGVAVLSRKPAIQGISETEQDRTKVTIDG